MNSSSARTRSSSDSGALAERVQQNWHLFFSVLMVPVVCLSVLENGLALAVLLRVRAGRGLGATSRAYYLVLAAAYIGYLLGYHVAKCFAEFGLRYPNADGNTNEWICRMLRGTHFFFIHLLNWTYALLNFERLVAVCWPLASRRLFSVRSNLTAVCVTLAVGAMLSVYLSSMFTVMSPPHMRIDALCGPDTLRNDWFLFIAVTALCVYAGPHAIAFWLAVAILVRLVSARRSRAALLERPSSTTIKSGTQSQSVPRVAVGGALTAVTMALVHMILTLPVGSLTLAFYICLRRGAPPELLGAIFRANHAAISWMSVGSLADFFIYYFRIRAFREALSSFIWTSQH